MGIKMELVKILKQNSLALFSKSVMQFCLDRISRIKLMAFNNAYLNALGA